MSMTRPRLASLRSLATALVLGAGLAACSDDPTSPPLDDAMPATAEVFAHGSETPLAHVHGDHWHGSLQLAPGGSEELDVRFLDADGEEIPLTGDRTVRAAIADGQPTGVATVESHGDHLDVVATAVGETRIVIHFWRDGRAQWSTPPLRVTVAAL